MDDRAGGEREAGRMTREERLAAKLRENLHRRKAQARALAGDTRAPAAPDKATPRLPKSPPRS